MTNKNSLLLSKNYLSFWPLASEQASLATLTIVGDAKTRNFTGIAMEPLEQGIEFINDMSEAQVIQLIKEGKLPAIALWLKHYHPRYGGKNIRRPTTGMPELTPEEEKALQGIHGHRAKVRQPYQTMTNDIDLKKIEQVLGNQNLRKSLAYEDPLWFCLIYLRHHLSYPLAPFHREMGHILKDPKHQLIVVMAFRESGKSTIMNTGNILWSILGKPQKKFAVIVSQTQDQAKSHFMSIKDELLSNDLLRADFGPFADNEAEWKKMSLEFVYHESKIQSVSLEQSIRGLKHGTVRPDLIVCDDIEDVSTAKDETSRNVAWQRLTSEILPLGSKGTRIIILGNLICPDSLLMRLKKQINKGRLSGTFRAYPLLDDERRILWPERFPDIDSVREMKSHFTSGVWTREFLLKILGWYDGRDDDDNHARILDGREPRYTAEKVIYQIPLVDQMKPFIISVPIDTPRKDFTIADDASYQRYYGNVDIDSPMMSAEEYLYLSNISRNGLGNGEMKMIVPPQEQRRDNPSNEEVMEAYETGRDSYRNRTPTPPNE